MSTSNNIPSLKKGALSVWHNPLGRTAVLSGGIAAAGYLANKPLSRLLVRLLFADKSKEEREKLVEELNTGRFKFVAPATGAALGAILANAGTADFSGGLTNIQGLKRLGNSLINSDYWSNERGTAKFNKLHGKPSGIDDLLFKLPVDMYKGASTETSFFNMRTVPVGSSINMINRDSYLSNEEKGIVNNLLLSANNNKLGIVSPRRLTDTVLNAGLGFGTAYLFGKVTGSLLGLPPPITERLSMIGGVANGLRSTGVF